MGADKGIAVIGLPTLAAMGVKSMVGNEHDVRVVSYATYDDFRSFEEGADGFIVTPEVFVGNLDYFMPRRQKTLLYGNFHSASSAHGSESREGERVIMPADDEAVIGEKLTSLIESIAKEAVEPGELSAREKEVLRLLVAGKINKEIADKLCISINTVITHRKNITAKTGIKSVSGLSIYALMNGIT